MSSSLVGGRSDAAFWHHYCSNLLFLCLERNGTEAARRRCISEVCRRLLSSQADISTSRSIATRQIHETARDGLQSVWSERWHRTEARNSAFPHPKGTEDTIEVHQLTIIISIILWWRKFIMLSNHKGLATADAEMVCVGKRRTRGSTAEGQGERK